MANYDLTPTIFPYLDRHLTFPLIQFLEFSKMYPMNQLLKAKLALLQKTNMVDYAADVYKQVHDTEDVPEEFSVRRDEVISQLTKGDEKCKHLMEVLGREDVLSELRQDKMWNLEYLREQHGVTLDMLEDLYQHARFNFNTGNYSAAAEYLTHYRVLSTDNDKLFSALWGKFAAEILMQNWETAMEDMNRLRDSIDSKTPTGPQALQQLHQRTWLIHWGLFVFFNHPKGRDAIIDMFFQPQYLTTIQSTCPHILRYLTTAVMTNKRRRNVVKELVRAIQQESYRYKDPITEFLECLLVNFDFDAAQQKLRECEMVLSNDFFLVSCRDEFIENARLFIFENYCRIHQVISISMLGEKLNMTPEEAEIWIVNLIRNARLDAKIDSKQGTVIMGTQIPSVYHQVIEMTKFLSFRSHVLADNIDKRQQGGNQNQQGQRPPMDAAQFEMM
eukprot:comp20637_c0_seq1/m.26716 comp20637_c0_seq1/g.26716  ORF comp20637_c0_seq1/g.26716 comp20637_c0_seq1/m.26716 type:complete len:445 (-) comp20637_c0_seq1:140-1474(-)